MANTNSDVRWSKAQIKEFAARIRKAHGAGWPYLVPEVRTALVDSFVLNIIRSQSREAVPVDAMDALYLAMHIEMGTGDVGE